MWQVLPLVPVDQNGSPYWARSDRAGNPALLDNRMPVIRAPRTTSPTFARSRAGCATTHLFEALGAEQEGAPWWRWPAPLRDRDPDALARAEQRLAPAIDALAREQWRFDAQWRALRAACRRRAMCASSATCRSMSLRIRSPPGLRASSSQLQANGEVAEVAGVPPDYFSVDGQLLGQSAV